MNTPRPRALGEAVAGGVAAPAAPDQRPAWLRALAALVSPWLRLTIEPGAAAAWRDDAVCYVLEDYAQSNALILAQACREAGLPAPHRALPGAILGGARAYFALSRRNVDPLAQLQVLGGGESAPPRRHSASLARLLAAQATDRSVRIRLVPVSIFVGRAPQRSRGWFSVLFAENWALAGRVRRLLAVALNGRDTLVRFAAPLDLHDALGEGLSTERTVRKLSRVLRVHFRRTRSAVIGPDLSTRRVLLRQVLDSPAIRAAIADQARRDGSDAVAATRKACGYAQEIAADYSHVVVRSMSFLLRPVWNRIYRGIRVHHLDALKREMPGYEVVYVPSHRSHLDDLLLPYLLYTHGVVSPHIVAGVNLDLPLLGRIMRKGGAFFIRRSLRGNVLYSAVFSAYMAHLVAGGYSLAYFIEGGRSRTGRLLPPQGGTLTMTVRAYLRQPTRPVLFQPVYIGYEKLMEGRSYLDELAGKAKSTESIWSLLRGLPGVLRSNYGQVVVNFGEPIRLDDVLAEHAPQWDRVPLADADKPGWLSGTVQALAQRINVRINAAANANPVNLLALALLATPRHAMSEADLLAQLTLSLQLLRDLPFSARVTVTELAPREIVAYGESMGLLVRVAHPLGDVLQVEAEQAVLLSYFRNNVQHLFIEAAWLACCFQHDRRMSEAGVLRLGQSLYPFLQAELFLPWSEAQFAQRLQRCASLLVDAGLLQRETDAETVQLSRPAGQSDEVFRLRSLGHPLQQAFERYYIALALLAKNGPGTISASELEASCQLTAQRLSLLYAPAAPEFFDRTLFHGFIQKLRAMQLVRPDAQGKLVFDEQLEARARDAKLILGREVRATIERISPDAVARPG